VTDITYLEPWLGKHALAHHLACSVRWIEGRISEGMPYAMIAGSRKFRVSEVERWLEAHGYLERFGTMTA
jgi:hypothetical protein